MSFELFTRGSAPRTSAPVVTVQKRGIVSINGPAHDLIGKTKVVEVLFDRERRIMALRPSEPSANSYNLRKPTKTGQTTLSATAFTKRFDIDTTVSRRYEPFVEDDMLCIAIDGPHVELGRTQTKKDSPPDDGGGE